MTAHSLSVRLFLAAFFILHLLPQAQASLVCSEVFDDSARLVDRIQTSDLKRDWSPQDRVFSDTLGATIFTGVAWLTAVQVAKSFLIRESGQPIFTHTYMLTVPIDVLLTVVSHFVSLGKVPGLQKIMRGDFVKGKLEYWYRTAVNTVMSSSVIVASWAAAGIDINSSTILAASTLSAGVYATLQVTKPFLFKTLPERKGIRANERFKENEPEISELLYKAALEQTDRLGVDIKTIETNFIYALDSLVLRTSYETRIPTDLLAHGRISKLIEQIAQVKEQLKLETEVKQSHRLAISLKSLRRKLVHQLLDIYSKGAWQNEIVRILKIDRELGVEGSIKLHRILDEISAERQTALYVASIADQALAVGIAGGVFLYSTTHWASTGEIPLFLQSLGY